MLWVPWFGTATFATYSGDAYAIPSSGCEKSLPKFDALTFAGVRTVSAVF